MKNTHKIKNILLIDDDADDCLFLSRVLAEVSDQVALSCVQSIDHLFESIALNKPTLIILDFHLPKKSGLDCLKLIKTHPEYSSIPVVIWSTSYIMNNVKAACAQGAQNFIQKPCSYTELVTEIREVLLQNGLELKSAFSLI